MSDPQEKLFIVCQRTKVSSFVCSVCGHFISVAPVSQEALRTYNNSTLICILCAPDVRKVEIIVAPGQVEEVEQKTGIRLSPDELKVLGVAWASNQQRRRTKESN